ncbi:MAG: hypothetical protein ACE5KU_02795 [Nitrososphaerales archaeon]
MKPCPHLRLFGGILFGSGVSLLGLHIYEYGYTELTDFIGHEWYGLILIILSFILLGRRWQR